MEPNVKLDIEMTIDKGRGYVTVEENKMYHDGINVIAIDSIHTPVRNVMYRIEPFRVEQRMDFDKLVLEVTTDASIHPKEALKRAASILMQHFALFSDEKITMDIEEAVVSNDFDESSLHIRQVLKTRLADVQLSVRALNCLKAADVETIGELVSFNKSDLLKFRNFGKKSLIELEDLVKSKGLEFGMNINRYRLDIDKE
jgi:DNA-directed RNA polymerase subunit alpha